MKTSTVGMYALRLTLGQPSHFSSSANADRVVTRSAAMMAAFGIAISSFSLKQMLTSSSKQSPSLDLQKY